ncbi:MAG: class I SAM-dependent methyltransferase [Emcibacteraceae bacterium]|nr:class I SAM-dependent methyltransferase [Emcibacteraceae bacterium]
MTETEKWEQGCRTDRVRNEFIIPTLYNQLEQFKPQEILDIGSGTAYIARAIDEMLSYNPHWTIIDTSQERIDFSISKMTSKIDALIQKNSYEEVSKSGTKFDAIFLLFTLLEMEFDEKICKKLNESLNDNGFTYIVMPNSLEDVFNAAQDDYDILFNYLNNDCQLHKIDKFTKEPYPFNAHRFEYIIQCMLKSGHKLIHMQNEKFNNKETYLLVFQKVKS